MFTVSNRRVINPRSVVSVALCLLLLIGVYQVVSQLSGDGLGNAIGSNLRQAKSFASLDNVEVVSWKPRIFLYRGFLSPEECDHIISIGEPHVQRSQVVGAKGNAVVSEHRTSYGTFLTRQARTDPILKSISKRIEQWTQLPESHGEAFYLLRYQLGQEYKAHMDWFSEEKVKTMKEGNRIATVLMYLSDVEEGGETYFPRAVGGPITVKPRKGDAVLFWDFTPEGKPDPLSEHAALPVKKGTKYAMTRWIRERPYK